MTRTLGGSLEMAAPAELIGRVISNYKLVSVLGRGGAGTVYLGERADHQFSAQAAVKVVDRMAAMDLGMRLRFERQILASLNHPNIARLIDAGETDDRRPYLVMEYVQGTTLDRYCDEKRLGLRARLELFIEICAAVQYAHQNLIVHRDLKPANILVTPEGIPKLLDFGIAKLLSPGHLGSAPELTRMNERLLTPEYASPEQVIGGAVTTASDIYSLGVILYRLLSGLRPYDISQSSSDLETQRSICAVDPPRPSTALLRAMQASRGEEAPDVSQIAAERGLPPERLHRRLMGDLDSIVMRAMRKEPDRRYSSVERFVADIRHHLSNEPVQARQGNWAYYTQRFVRRHTAAVVAGAGFLAFVIAVAVVMSIQRQSLATALEQATHDRERAENVSKFMLNVFSAADPFTNFGREPTARILLDQAARNIQSDLTQQPQVRARLLEAIGRSYRRMGQPERAIVCLQDALSIQQSLPPQEADIGPVVTELAIALREDGRIDESDRYFGKAQQLLRDSNNRRPAAHAQLLVDLGRLEKLRSNTTQALGYLTEALNLIRELKGPKDLQVGEILAEMSNILVWSDDLEGAERAARQSVDIYGSVPELHPDRVMADYYLADILFYRGRIDEAATLLERVVAAQRKIYGPVNGTVADTLGSLAQVRLAQENIGEAQRLLAEAIAAHKGSESTAYLKIGYLQTMLATVWIRNAKLADAEQLLRDTLELYAKHIAPDHQYVASAEHYLGEALLLQHKFADAQKVLTSAMDRWKRSGAPGWRVARSASALGEALHRQRRDEEAERYLVESYRELSADPAADRESKRIAHERIARFYTDLGQRQKLDALIADRAATPD
jgi:serine/threonine protein kinase/TolA-binding protein